MPNGWNSLEEESQCSSMDLGGEIITVSHKTWQQGHWKKKARDDASLWIKTMFPVENCSSLVHSRKYYNEEKQKGEFLQRLFLVLYSAPLKYASIDRSNKKDEMQIWPYPLAMALSHGGRILFRVKGIEIKPFLNWVLTGNMDNITPSFLKERMAASHGVEYNKATGEMIEIKLKGVRGLLTNIKSGLMREHCYVNLSFGGLGSNDGFGNLVAFDGHRFNPTLGKIDTEVQHGHCYIFCKDFGFNKGIKEGALLIAVEGSEPGKKTAFGEGHTVINGIKSSKEHQSISGGRKFELLLGEKAPLPYNGMIVDIDEASIRRIVDEWNLLSDERIEDRHIMMWRILNNGADQFSHEAAHARS